MPPGWWQEGDPGGGSREGARRVLEGLPGVTGRDLELRGPVGVGQLAGSNRGPATTEIDSPLRLLRGLAAVPVVVLECDRVPPLVPRQSRRQSCYRCPSWNSTAAHREDGAPGARDHARGHTAEEKLREPRAAVRAHHDQVRLPRPVNKQELGSVHLGHTGRDDPSGLSCWHCGHFSDFQSPRRAGWLRKRPTPIAPLNRS